MTERLLLQQEVAARLRMPVSSLRYLRAQGTGPKGARIGKRVLYRASDVEAWIAAKYADNQAA